MTMRIPTCLLLTALCTATAQAQLPLPSVTGPLTNDSQTHGFGMAAWAAQPQDLSAHGYIEEEFLVSGAASVYDWPEPGTLNVQTQGAGYSTRILVRRPVDGESFSGTVVVEPLNPVYQFDLNTGWALSGPLLLRNGDVWVGVTARPSSVASLITFDPTRYGVLDWSNPLPVTDPRNCMVSGSDSQYTENGLVYDILRQTAAWLRSDAPGNPLRYGDSQSRADRVYGWGYGESGGILHTYINALHNLDVEALGEPLFHAYLIGASFSPALINQCAERITPEDPRYRIRNPGVPVIRVLTQFDVLRAAQAGRRQMDDRATDAFYRIYEVAGAAHATAEELNASAQPGDITLGGRSVPAMTCNEGPRSRFPNQFAFSAALYHLNRWARDIADPPHGEPIRLDDGRYVLDEHGNVLGGLRSPYVDVPVSTWVAASRGPGGCDLAGHELPFDKDALERMFRSNRAYVQAVQDDLPRHVEAGFILADDAPRIIEQARLTPVP